LSNAEIAQMLHEFADLMELQGDVFKQNAYRRAARGVEALEEDIRQVIEEGRLEQIPGVGKGIALRIREMVETGGSKELEKLRLSFPPGLSEVMMVPEVGPRTAARLYRELGVTNLEQLKRAAMEHRIRELPGFGERSEENILKGIDLVERHGRRMLLSDALAKGEALAEHVRSSGFPLVSVAGSMRRMRETVGDVDILVGTDRPDEAMKVFVSYPHVESTIVRGGRKTSVRLADGTQADMRVVPEASYGAALQYFTGSKEHNIKLRRLAIRKGLRLNEYGLFDASGNNLVAGKPEEEIYRLLGLQPMPPELREDRGEIEAAAEGRLPVLVEQGDIRGDLHIHTVMSDGHGTMREMVMAAMKRGYEYVGLTDHSASLHVAHGLDDDELLASIEQAHRLGDELGFPILRGAEVDILEDGTLDYPKEVLDQLDYVIGSVHTRFKMGVDEMTERVVRAIRSGRMNILGHPTGRLLGRREAYSIDLDTVMDEARENRVALEVNGFPDRLDLNDVNCRKAKEKGVMVVLNTDAHREANLSNMRLAVGTARRGWLEHENVLNCLPYSQLKAVLSRKTDESI
jgi:DNA polymerase (family 10)